MTGAIDADWRAAHPLPAIGDGQDKSERGTIVVVGGSSLSPGASVLTAEAALRVGAGRVQLGTIAAAADGIGVTFPECAVIALPADADGEIADTAPLTRHLDRCDALAIGPGMALAEDVPGLLSALLERRGPRTPAVIDAGAIAAIGGLDPALLGGADGCAITPHHGELAKLMDWDAERIADDPAAAAQHAANQFGIVVVLKDATTFIAAPDRPTLHHISRAPGLGTAGSGDVLAGVIAGLVGRGVPVFEAAAWGVFLHAEAGRLASLEIGDIGFLARELLPRLPRLVSSP